MIREIPILFLILSLFFVPATSMEVKNASNQTQNCIECHSRFTPGIVEDWLRSRHAATTPGEALTKDRLERRISVEYISSIPESYQSVSVGCYECHSQNPEKHRDNFMHNGYRINAIVSPEDCKTCHPAEVGQYSKTVKAHAYNNLEKNPVYKMLYETITTVYSTNGTEIEAEYPSTWVQNSTCFACHGTKLTVNGLKEIKRQDITVKVPDIAGWPNQGVGRINPDGSKGACTACHPRHSIKIDIARSPFTCKQCHYEPDVPAFNAYTESKHGNIFLSQNANWNFSAVPWRIGEDFQAPMCAVCHNALVVDGSGNVVAERTHQFDARIWLRLFGIYSHPQPLSGETYKIVNDDGQPLPTTFAGKPASDYLISPEEQEKRKEQMKKVCTQCHSTDWVNKQFIKLERNAEDTDRMVLEGTKLMEEGWGRGVADSSNPFDEHLERLWVEQWLFYASSIRHGDAMIGPDYMAFEEGWYDLTANLYRMKEAIELSEKEEKKSETVAIGCQNTPGFELTAVIVALFLVFLILRRNKI